MSSGPLVSIVIPVYNGANYLREAIDSALRQTYENVEVIVVNDGSDDGSQTEAIAKSYGDRIRYLYKENGGVSSALNVGIRNMRGEWFAWLSHDDLFSSDRIETDMNLSWEMPKAWVMFCKSKTIDAEGNVIGERAYPIQKVTNPREVLMLKGVGMCTMTIRGSCFEQVGLFNEANRTTQDVEMTLRLSCAYPFFFNAQAVTYRREHPNRGTYILSEQRRQGIRLLCDFVHREFPLWSFFPDLGEDDDEVTNAWIWMGNWYRGFEATDYADECYRCAIAAQRSVLGRWRIALDIKAKTLDKPIMRRLVRGIRRAIG